LETKEYMTRVSNLISEVEQNMRASGFIKPAKADELTWEWNGVFRIMINGQPLIETAFPVRERHYKSIPALYMNARKASQVTEDQKKILEHTIALLRGFGL
jgi:hypothetical protein